MWLIRLFVWLVSLAMIPVVMAFAVANNKMVEVSLEPVQQMLVTPLWVVVMASVAVGFVWGGLAAWTSGAKARRTARDRSYEASKAKREVANLKDHVLALEATKATAESQAEAAQ